MKRGERELGRMMYVVSKTLVKVEKELTRIETGRVPTEVEKDRVAYKEGLVDGLCMMSWVDEVGTDWVGEKDNNGEGKLLKDVLDEIGSVYGFDGAEQLKRVKTAEVVDAANEEAGELIDKPLKDEIDPDATEAIVTDIKGKEVDNNAGNDTDGQPE